MRARSLATRVAVASLVVALIAAVVAALATARLVERSSREHARSALASQADVLATTLTELPARQWPSWAEQVRTDLAAQGVDLVTVGASGGALLGPPGAVAAAERAGATTGQDLSRLVLVDRTTWLVEARAAGPAGFVLVEAWQPGVRLSVTRAVVVASLVGLLGAGVAGAVLSGVVSRPLRRVAEVARRMREGHRDLRAPVEGPHEVADVAASINELADSLARSEGRERAFLHSVSHELRTPLTAVRGFAESIADGVADDPQAAARTVLAEAARLEHLVADLLDLARLGADDFRLDLAEVDLTALVHDAGEVWSRRGAQAGVPVQVELPAAPVLARTDPRRLRQVVDALADNALRVTPAGRRLVLALHEGATADGLVLEVRDGGPGLAPEDYPVAFERGVLHHRYGAGRAGSSGIGLSLVAGLVGRLGGRIGAYPAPEGGAAFRVDLPRHGPAQTSG